MRLLPVSTQLRDEGNAPIKTSGHPVSCKYQPKPVDKPVGSGRCPGLRLPSVSFSENDVQKERWMCCSCCRCLFEVLNRQSRVRDTWSSGLVRSFDQTG
jgi:hypothetical protein